MSADLLREAAALMRERAEAATESERWGLGNRAVRIEYQPNFTAVAHAGTKANAEHIASWHPAVALAVADWLDDEAEWVAAGSTPGGRAYDLARAYLGRTA